MRILAIPPCLIPNSGLRPIFLLLAQTATQYDDACPHHKGRLPEDTDEIILPVHLLRNGGTEFSIGDRITLDIGVRMYDNKYSVSNMPSQLMKTVQRGGACHTETRSFTVVGFYERPSFESFTSPGYTAITVMDGTVREGETYDVYFKLKSLQAYIAL